MPFNLPPLASRWIREIDRRAIAEYGMTGLVLMDHAARSVCDLLDKLHCRGPVVIVCGKGNNGGDGFALARLLDALEIPVSVLLFASPEDLRGDARTNFAILCHCKISLWVAPTNVSSTEIQEVCGSPEWIIDCLLGTGSSGSPRFPLDLAISTINAISARKLAVDVPSGLNCDTGEVSATTFRAEHTVTFAALKPGLLMASATEFVGELHVASIGVPRRLIEQIVQEATDETRLEHR